MSWDRNDNPTYDVDWDEKSGAWCVFLGDKAIASFSDKAQAQEHLDRLLG